MDQAFNAVTLLIADKIKLAGDKISSGWSPWATAALVAHHQPRAIPPVSLNAAVTPPGTWEGRAEVCLMGGDLLAGYLVLKSLLKLQRGWGSPSGQLRSNGLEEGAEVRGKAKCEWRAR